MLPVVGCMILDEGTDPNEPHAGQLKGEGGS